MPAPARADEVNRIDAAGGGDHPDDARATYIRDPAGVLADVALVSAGPGELRPVLERLADLTIEATGAERREGEGRALTHEPGDLPRNNSNAVAGTAGVGS